MRTKSITVLLLGIALAATPLLGQRVRGGMRLQAPPQPRRIAPMGQNPAANPDRPMHGPGPHSGDWLRRYRGLPADQQRSMLQKDPNFQRLPAERQQKLIHQLDWFNQQSPERQQRILERMETWEHLTPEQHQQARQLFEHFNQLPEERKQRLHQAINRLSRMAPEDRQRALASEGFRSNFSEPERDMIGSALSLGVSPGRMRGAPGQMQPSPPPMDDATPQPPAKPKEE